MFLALAASLLLAQLIDRLWGQASSRAASRSTLLTQRLLRQNIVTNMLRLLGIIMPPAHDPAANDALTSASDSEVL